MVYSPSWSMSGCRGRKEPEAGTEAEDTHARTLPAACSPQITQLAFYTAQDTAGWAWHVFMDHENASQPCPQASLRDMFSADALFPDDSSCVRLTVCLQTPPHRHDRFLSPDPCSHRPTLSSAGPVLPASLVAVETHTAVQTLLADLTSGQGSKGHWMYTMQFIHKRLGCSPSVGFNAWCSSGRGLESII